MKQEEINTASVAARTLQALAAMPLNVQDSNYKERVNLAANNALLYIIFFLERANREIQNGGPLKGPILFDIS